MFNLILLTSLAHAAYQQPAPGLMTQPMTQPMQPYLMPYVLTKENSFCKNHGSEMRGEIAQSDTIVLQTPLAGGVMACAQSVMFHAQQNMCSDVFWANNNQCACLRPGAVCKEERSESGFGLYRLTRLGKKHGHKDCVKFDTEEHCSKKTHCEWKNEACAHKIKLSKEHMLGAYPGMTPQLGAYPQTGFVPGMSPQLGVGAYPRAGAPMTGAYPAAGQMGNMQTALVPWRQGMDCEREIDEHTGLNSVIDLQPATTVHGCYQAVQMNFQCNPQQFVYQTRLDGYPGECNCVRVNMFCDEENKPSNGLGSNHEFLFLYIPNFICDCETGICMISQRAQARWAESLRCLPTRSSTACLPSRAPIQQLVQGKSVPTQAPHRLPCSFTPQHKLPCPYTQQHKRPCLAHTHPHDPECLAHSPECRPVWHKQA